ncbi:hypothetical protein AA958_08420 [Streptomyces sp. CNQ-509]|nr:hypothetical protein AA958_08420 [Streptomyces sp. CNQ-509]
MLAQHGAFGRLAGLGVERLPGRVAQHDDPAVHGVEVRQGLPQRGQAAVGHLVRDGLVPPHRALPAEAPEPQDERGGREDEGHGGHAAARTPDGFGEGGGGRAVARGLRVGGGGEAAALDGGDGGLRREEGQDSPESGGHPFTGQPPLDGPIDSVGVKGGPGTRGVAGSRRRIRPQDRCSGSRTRGACCGTSRARRRTATRPGAPVTPPRATGSCGGGHPAHTAAPAEGGPRTDSSRVR